MNFFEVIIGAVITIVIGFLWYSPLLFAKPWMKLIGKSEKDLKNGNMGTLYGVTFFMAIVLSFTMMYFVDMLQITTASNGALLGCMFWFGLIIAATISDYVFAGRPMKLYAINMGYYLVVLLVVGGLFGAWH